MIFEALQSELFSLKFYSLSLKSLKILEFNLIIWLIVWPKLALNSYFRCINKCDALKAQLGSMKVKDNQPELNLVDLPTEIQDKIMMNMNCLKDLESMSEATPFLTQIAAEYEKVCLLLVHGS